MQCWPGAQKRKVAQPKRKRNATGGVGDEKKDKLTQRLAIGIGLHASSSWRGYAASQT